MSTLITALLLGGQVYLYRATEPTLVRWAGRARARLLHFGLLAFQLLILAAVLLAACWAAPIPQEPAVEQPGSGRAKYAYVLDCAGRYLRIDSGTHAVQSSGSIWDAAATKTIQPPYVTRCEGWLVGDIKPDANRGLIYAALAVESTYHARHYRIAALEMPGFALQREFTIGHELMSPPAIALDHNRDQLVVAYDYDQKSDGAVVRHYTLARYRLPSLEAVDRITRSGVVGSLAPGVLGPLAPSVRFPGDGEPLYFTKRGTIASGNRIFDLTGKLLEEVTAATVLTEPVRSAVRDIQAIGVDGRRRPAAVTPVGSGSDRMLFVVGSDTLGFRRSEGTALVVYDVATRRPFSPIRTPYQVAPNEYNPAAGTPTAHLTPDGNRVIVEQYEWRAMPEVHPRPGGPGEENQRPQRFKTGAFALYDVVAGSLVRTMQLHEAPGFFARVLGFSADGDFLYHYSRFNGKLYVIDLTGAQRNRSIDLPDRFEPGTLFFADR